MNEETLVARATQGQLSAQELQQVAQGMLTGRSDPYEALLIIGRAGATQYRSLVEKYLDFRDDPMLARLALQVLCRYWGLATEYVETIERFICKVDWDREDDVRLMAIDCAGSIVADSKNSRLISLLLKIFRDSGERQIVREAAYGSLALAAGKTLNELPAASRHFYLQQGVDPAVIAFANKVVQRDDEK